ncbi:MAG: hypothetical protein E6K12_01335 [Methanobacteriota archaeon]|nr:MAG: hypothetical protein E6K15_01255 [Euryarchaeota archaeon]TLZ68456.1 MAG: hypothetical protein E6K12_01335 [Euryarchaeota archaeon]
MNPLGINREDLDLLSRTVLRLGGYAEGLFDFHDFGFDKASLKDHITSVHANLKRLRDVAGSDGVPLRPPNIPAGAFWEDQGEVWNYLQTLRFAAGATMMSEQYSSHMTTENLHRSMTAKIFRECVIGILDDLIDKGNYSYLEAKDLHHMVLSSMLDPDLDSTAFMKRLVTMLRQEQIPLFDLINNIVRGFNVLWNNSPHGHDYFYQMEIMDERVALGQALSMFQKEPNFSIPRMEKIMENFYAPDDTMYWWEKLGGHVSAASRHNLIDMAFTDRPYDIKHMKNFLAGWYYYDAAVILMDHVVSIHQDLRNGIANLSLIAMREKELRELTSLKNYNPHLTIEDYDGHLRRIADLTSKAIRLATADVNDETLVYPFMTIMMPVVMMADWIGNRDDMIHMFLEAIAPTIRRVAGNGTVPTKAIVEAIDEVARGS